MANKFIVWLTRTFMVILLIALIFSYASLEIDGMIKGLFGDVFSFASLDAQRETIKQLSGNCALLGQGKQLASMGQICFNQTLYLEIQENCKRFRQFKNEDILVENEENLNELCKSLESGEIERACKRINEPSIFPDLGKFAKACSEYPKGNMSDRMFFAEVLSSPFGNQKPGMPIFMTNYLRVNDFLNRNRIFYFVALSVLTYLLYALLKDLRLFSAVLGQISLSLGIIILLPFASIFVYEKLVGIDTTPILSTFFGSGSPFEPKAVISLVFLLFLRTYNFLVLMIGIIFLCLGVTSKIYLNLIRKKYGSLEGKSEERKKEKLDNLLKDLENKPEKGKEP